MKPIEEEWQSFRKTVVIENQNMRQCFFAGAFAMFDCLNRVSDGPNVSHADAELLIDIVAEMGVLKDDG